MKQRLFSTRSIAIFCLILSPFFTFAQSTSTSSASQTTPESINLQNQIDELISNKSKAIPSIEEIRTNALRDLLEVTTTPKNPKPLEKVTVSVESYLSDLNKAQIEWVLNGKIVSRGVGEKSFSFQNGPSGKTTRLVVSITTNAGEVFTKNLSWNPVGVTVLWEADTYTPPFYRGKPLLTAQAKLKTVAIPDNTTGGNALSAGNFVYVWEKDGTTITENSGFQKNTYLLSGPKPYERMNVKVRASSLNDSISSETQVDLSLSAPFILFYEKHPLFGVWYNRPFDNKINLAGREFSISAEPYFFSNESREDPINKYTWMVNGKAVQNYGHTITLRNDTGEKGSSSISLAVRGINKTFQAASRDLLVYFAGESSARPIF